MAKKKKVVLLISAVLISFACCFGFMNTIGASAQSTANLFFTNGVVLSTHQQAPLDKISGDERCGLLMTAGVDGQSAKFSSEIIGQFEIDFLVYSKDAFQGDVTSSVYENTYADLQELTFKFKDVDDETNCFNVVFTPGYEGNCVTPTARISVNEVDAGIVNSGDSAGEQTAIYNEKGVYTSIEGSSFSNLAYKDNVSTKRVQSIILSFNPDTMCVYVKANNSANLLVWNFSNQINDAKDIGFTLNKMHKYSVEIEFSDIVDGRQSNLLIYSINGRDVSWHYLANDEKVGIETDVCFNGIVNQPYKIPMPSFSENYKSGTVTVVGPIQNETFTLSDNLTFEPKFEGSYNLIYNVESNKGVLSSYEYSIEVFNAVPEVYFNFSSILYEETYGTGSIIKLPKVLVNGGLLKNQMNAYLSIYLDGNVLSDYESIVDYGDTFVFEKAGKYQIVFSSSDGNSEKKYEFIISDDLPKFEILDFDYDFSFGETFIAPTWRIFKDGQECLCSIEIVKPSGQVVEANQIVVDSLGLYEVRYNVAISENKTLCYKRYFSAKQVATKIFSSNGAKISSEVGAAWFNSNLNGLIVSSSASFTATYANVIDLSNNTKDDLLLEIAVLPDTIGVENFNELLIKFTDVDNDENYFAIDILSGVKGGDKKYTSYVKAGATNQVRSGLTDGQFANLQIGGTYGTYTHFTFSGTYANGEVSNKTLKFYYDCEENAVYCCYSGTNKIRVIDFDSTECFSTLWEGFTSGKAIMSIQTLGYKSGKTSVVIKSIDGFELNSKYLTETEKPFIIVDTLNYSEDMLPNAVVGMKYDLFTATAQTKLQGILNVNIDVYFNYGKVSQEKIDITDGFIPIQSGDYTIVYSVVDNYGVTNNKTLKVKCVNKSSYKDITSNISNSDNKTLYVGQRDTIKNIIVSGGQGKLDIKTAITDEFGKNVEINNKGDFILLKAGTYTVSYSVKDYLGTEKCFSYVINCLLSDSPVVNDEVYLPNGFVSGFNYKLPEILGYDYSENGIAKKAQVKIYVLNESGKMLYALDDDFIYKPDIKDGNSVIIRYLVGGANGFTIKDYKVNIIDAVNIEEYEIDKTKLFVTENVLKTNAQDGYVSFDVNSNAKISFINDLTENNISLTLGAITDSTKNKIGKIRVYLTDSLDSSVRISFDVVILPNSVKVYDTVSGEEVTVGDVIVDEYVSAKFSFKLSDNTLRSESSSLLISFKTTENGDVFDGFPSGKVRIDMELSKIVGAPKFLIFELGGFVINSDTDDIAPPQIYIKDDFVSYVLTNNIATIPAAVVADVVSPTSKVLLSATFKGKAVKDLDGIELKDVDGTKSYRFVPTEVGSYLVTYYYYDAFDNSNVYKKSITVVEKNSPTIVVNGNIPAKTKVGAEITIPTFTVSDDTTASENIKTKVYMLTPTGTFENVDTTYVFNSTGKYILRYIAFDALNNYTITDYVIEVTK